MAMFARIEDRRQKRRQEEGGWRSTVVDFQAYRRPLVEVSEFKYLGRVLTASDDNWPVVVGNLRKAQKQWAWMSRILGWEVADPRTSDSFNKVVLQETLLIYAETWLMSPWIGKTM